MCLIRSIAMGTHRFPPDPDDILANYLWERMQAGARRTAIKAARAHAIATELTPRRRQAWLLRVKGRLSYAQIGERMGISAPRARTLVLEASEIMGPVPKKVRVP